MAELLQFPTSRCDDTGFIDLLVNLLDAARSGRVQSYAVVFVSRDEEDLEYVSYASSNVRGTSQMKLLGTVELMKHKLLEGYDG